MRNEKQIIHCIGDSHINVFSGQKDIQPIWPEISKNSIEFFKTYRLGPVLAYNLCKLDTETKGREKLFKILNTIPKNSTIILSFGEIDCRFHLLKQSEIQKRSIEDIVNECVERYFSVILEVKNLNYNVLILEVIPSTPIPSSNKPEFPIYGTCTERNNVTSIFNKYLEKLLNKKSIPMIRISKKITNRDGFIKTKYLRDPVHLNQKAIPIIIEEINKINNINLKIKKQKNKFDTNIIFDRISIRVLTYKQSKFFKYIKFILKKVGLFNITKNILKKMKKFLNIKKYPLYFRILKNRFFPIFYKTSYSQLGEDLIINFIFKNLQIEKPTYIDIGTNDPIKLNNTYLFYKKRSRGICVEPDPELFKKIKKERPRDICLNIGIGTEENSQADYYIMDSDVLNTFSKDEADNLEKTTKKKVEKIIQIPLVPLNKIIKENFNGETPNFMSLDTEGFDFGILKSIDFNKFRPEVICVETLTYTENKSERKEQEIIDFMIEKGYYVHADTYINTIFVDKQKWLNR